MIRIVSLVAPHGRGSNMRAITEGCISGQIRGQMVAAIAPSPDAPALAVAAELGVDSVVVRYEPEPTYQSRLLDTLRSLQPDLIVLAGYLRKLSPEIVDTFSGRIMNIHPALVPAFAGEGMYGRRVHEAVLEAGVKVSGCTVHFVDYSYDTGPIILQECVRVKDDDSVESLAARVLEQEHRLYPMAVSLFAQNRLRIEDHKVRIEGERES